MFETNGGMEDLKRPQDPYLDSISQCMQKTEFYSFLANVTIDEETHWVAKHKNCYLFHLKHF